MNDFPGIKLPPELELSSIEKNTAGETNTVFFSKARFHGQNIEVYIKVAKGWRHSLENERDVLEALLNRGIQVPKVLCYRESPVPFLVLESLPGRMVWDFIDPRRDSYEAGAVIRYLRSYGRCLAQIHQLPIHWPRQTRARLNGLIGEEIVADRDFQELVSWLQSNAPCRSDDVFVHGDLNTASVLFLDGNVSGIVDWEFAGRGWREYDLAWTLRARRSFLNSPAERDAVLQGYRENGTYGEDALRWCEVLNYLHFAYWSRDDRPEDTLFCIQRAQSIAGLSRNQGQQSRGANARTRAAYD